MWIRDFDRFDVSGIFLCMTAPRFPAPRHGKERNNFLRGVGCGQVRIMALRFLSADGTGGTVSDAVRAKLARKKQPWLGRIRCGVVWIGVNSDDQD